MYDAMVMAAAAAVPTPRALPTAPARPASPGGPPAQAPEVPFPEVPFPDVAVEHRYVDVRGARLHVAEAGSGPPVVLLHGWPQHWWAWRHVLGPLARRSRVICPDVRGMGWSGGADGSFLWDALAADLVGLLDALGHERARLVGHDWGVQIGYRACLLFPERFERFVALAIVHPWEGWGPALSAGRRGGPWHIPLVAVGGRRVVTALHLAERGLRRWRHAGAFSDDEVATYLALTQRPSAVDAAVRYYRAAAFYETARAAREARFWRLAVPTLHLYGAYDELAPYSRRDFRPYADEMEVGVIRNCGHFVPEEAPAELLERLDAFL